MVALVLREYGRGKAERIVGGLAQFFAPRARRQAQRADPNVILDIPCVVALRTGLIRTEIGGAEVRFARRRAGHRGLLIAVGPAGMVDSDHHLVFQAEQRRRDAHPRADPVDDRATAPKHVADAKVEIGTIDLVPVVHVDRYFDRGQTVVAIDGIAIGIGVGPVIRGGGLARIGLVLRRKKPAGQLRMAAFAGDTQPQFPALSDQAYAAGDVFLNGGVIAPVVVGGVFVGGKVHRQGRAAQHAQRVTRDTAVNPEIAGTVTAREYAEIEILGTGSRVPGDHVDHPAGGAAAVQHRPAAAQDLDPLNAVQRHRRQPRTL